jgi:cytochrome c553
VRGRHFVKPGGLAVAVAVALGFAATSGPAAAQAPEDVAIGRSKARSCTVCHGALGMAVAADAPNIAGQPMPYLIAQLRAYRSGARRHEVMAVMAKPLSNEDIDHLGAWFSSIRVEATAPP